MKFKKQIGIVLFMSLLLTSCSFKFKAGIIKHNDNNERIEETEEVNKDKKVSEEEKKELVGKVKKELEELIVAISEITDEIKIEELLKNKYENCTSFIITDLYFASEEGEFYLIPEQDLPGGFDPRERDWYSNTKEYGESTALYIDAATESEVLSVYFLVKSNENVLGVLGVDINLELKE